MLYAARLVAPEADDILAKARSGDDLALAQLIRAHQGMVFSLAVHVLGNRATAEDVAQDVFLDLFRHLKTIDPAMLKLASGFLGSGKKDSESVQQLIAGLQGVYVKSFEFDRDGAYSAADVEAVRKQFTAPGWSRMVVVKEARETVDIYAWRQGDKAGGIGILVAEPRELTIVNIVGEIDMAKLASLQGQFGIPKLPLEQGAKPKGK